MWPLDYGGHQRPPHSLLLLLLLSLLLAVAWGRSLGEVSVAASSTVVTPCPPECICLSHTQVLCNTGGLTEVPLKTLPPTVEHLSLAKNDIPLIKSDAFSGLRALQRLSLDGNNISAIRPFAFRGLPRLRDLTIMNAPLAVLSQFAFAGLQNVSRIMLAHNRIARIEGYAFAGTSNVRLLLLLHNPLQRVERAAFAGLSHVERLLLPAGIRAIDPDAFNGLRSVGLLRLAFMDLSPPGLRPHTFRGLARVAVLAIHESDLGVLRAGAFEGLAAVGSLDLVGNKVDAVESLALSPSNRVRAIRFINNHLLETPAPGAVRIEGVEALTVFGNHFPCDCRLRTLLRSPFANSSDFAARNYCISPLSLNGRPISSVDVEAITRRCPSLPDEDAEAGDDAEPAAKSPMSASTNSAEGHPWDPWQTGLLLATSLAMACS
ncbi:leucine-rich repeat-containing protein 15 [Ischnura elegans]|uniref:leucine-rich repeat-containing protein 15 n=1 Tax=Ischnura elegans TaxID=197161 RepID=UPI001ED8730F|nr:leucine-rich repeat-containing protein 15 [Ischnura elegans]